MALSKDSASLRLAALSSPAPDPAQLIFRPDATLTRVVHEGAHCVLEVPMPWLAGPRREILANGSPLPPQDGFSLMKLESGLAGVAVADPGLSAFEASLSLYGGLLNLLGDHQLCRVWNYVPQINQVEGGVENYRDFNRGRHEAFAAAFGPGFDGRLPAASALGTGGDRFALAFLAGSGPARHVENPEQVPAFQYPAEYGPTPPSFARGTAVASPGGSAWYLSGTASIKGHASCGSDLETQARLTFDNVRLMFQHLGVPDSAGGAWKIFLRHRSHLAAAQAAFLEAFPGAGPAAMFLKAEICRSALLLEVEATFRQPHPSPLPLDALGSPALLL